MKRFCVGNAFTECAPSKSWNEPGRETIGFEEKLFQAEISRTRNLTEANHLTEPMRANHLWEKNLKEK